MTQRSLLDLYTPEEQSEVVDGHERIVYDFRSLPTKKKHAL